MVKVFVIAFVVFFPVGLFGAQCNTSAVQVPCLLQSIIDNTNSIKYSVDVTANGQTVIWSQSMSFLAGLLTATAFVTAATRRW